MCQYGVKPKVNKCPISNDKLKMKKEYEHIREKACKAKGKNRQKIDGIADSGPSLSRSGRRPPELNTDARNISHTFKYPAFYCSFQTTPFLTGDPGIPACPARSPHPKQSGIRGYLLFQAFPNRYPGISALSGFPFTLGGFSKPVRQGRQVIRVIHG